MIAIEAPVSRKIVIRSMNDLKEADIVKIRIPGSDHKTRMESDIFRIGGTFTGSFAFQPGICACNRSEIVEMPE